MGLISYGTAARGSRLAVIEADGGDFEFSDLLGRDAEHAHAAHAHAAHAAAHALIAVIVIVVVATVAAAMVLIAAVAAELVLRQHGHARKSIGQLHVQRLVGLVLDDHLALRRILRDQFHGDVALLDGREHLDGLRVRIVLSDLRPAPRRSAAPTRSASSKSHHRTQTPQSPIPHVCKS